MKNILWILLLFTNIAFATYLPNAVTSLKLDNVYSATITSTGAITSQNKTFITSCTNASPAVCTFTSGIFTVNPSCEVTVREGASPKALIAIATTSSVSVALDTGSKLAFDIVCQKQGNDYLQASADTYTQASANYSRTVYTPTFTNLGTPTSVSCFSSRTGETMTVECSFIPSSTGGSPATITLPNSLLSATNTIANGGTVYLSTTGSNQNSVILVANTNAAITFGVQSAGAAGLTPLAASSMFTAGQTVSFTTKIPIQGWTNTAYIVGSFKDYAQVPGMAANVRADHSSVSYGTTNATTVCSASPCSYINELGTSGSMFTSVTRSSTGNYTLNLAKTYLNFKCAGTVGVSTSGGSNIQPVSCTNCNSVAFVSVDGAASGGRDSYATLSCDGTY